MDRLHQYDKFFRKTILRLSWKVCRNIGVFPLKYHISFFRIDRVFYTNIIFCLFVGRLQSTDNDTEPFERIGGNLIVVLVWRG